jgi:hypothetical protein
VAASGEERTLTTPVTGGYQWLLSATSGHTNPRHEGMSLLKLLRLKRALPLFRVDEPPFLVDLVTLEPEQN